MLARYMLSSCVRVSSVCRSVTSWHGTKMAKRRITQTTPYDSQWVLFFDFKGLGEIPTGSPAEGAPNRGWVGSNRRFSINISLSKTVTSSEFRRDL